MRLIDNWRTELHRLAFKHGRYSAEAIRERRFFAELIKETP
jgi:hypothetical protein